MHSVQMKYGRAALKINLAAGTRVLAINEPTVEVDPVTFGADLTFQLGRLKPDLKDVAVVVAEAVGVAVSVGVDVGLGLGVFVDVGVGLGPGVRVNVLVGVGVSVGGIWGSSCATMIWLMMSCTSVSGSMKFSSESLAVMALRRSTVWR